MSVITCDEFINLVTCQFIELCVSSIITTATAAALSLICVARNGDQPTGRRSKLRQKFFLTALYYKRDWWTDVGRSDRLKTSSISSSV